MRQDYEWNTSRVSGITGWVTYPVSSIVAPWVPFLFLPILPSRSDADKLGSYTPYQFFQFSSSPQQNSSKRNNLQETIIYALITFITLYNELLGAWNSSNITKTQTTGVTLENARPRSGFPRSRLGIGNLPEKG